jgi:hypothetical protein
LSRNTRVMLVLAVDTSAAMFPRRFVESDRSTLDADQQARRSLAVQARALAQFTAREERLRVAPTYDFREHADGDALLYTRFDWRLRRHEWQELSRRALRSCALA